MTKPTRKSFNPCLACPKATRDRECERCQLTRYREALATLARSPIGSEAFESALKIARKVKP